MVRESLRVFASHPEVDLVLPVIHPDDTARFAAAAEGLDACPTGLGGATRQGSVRAGLEALEKAAPDIVLVHDAARPFTSEALVEPRHRGGGQAWRGDPRPSRHRHRKADRQ